MQKNHTCKILAVGIIVLFISVAVASCINVNVSSLSIESETVETTVKIYRSEGVTPHTIKLTGQESDEVDRLFDNIQVNLNSVETEEETDEIFNDAVVSLDELGLLPKDMTVEEAQQLVTGVYQNPSVMNPLGNLRGSNENFNCQVIGRTTNTYMFDLNPILNKILGFIRDLPVYDWHPFNFAYYFGKIGHISFGITIDYAYDGIEYYTSQGRVWTKGTNGTVTWNGTFNGKLGSRAVYGRDFFGVEKVVHMGVADFKGLWIDRFSSPPYFIGLASHVRLG